MALLKKGLNKKYDYDKLLNDNTKYRFAFIFDCGWDDRDAGDLADKLYEASEEGDKSLLANLLDEYFRKNDFPAEVKRVVTCVGPGGGWPEIEQVTNYMTFKDYVKYLKDDVLGDEPNWFFEEDGGIRVVEIK